METRKTIRKDWEYGFKPITPEELSGDGLAELPYFELEDDKIEFDIP